MTKKHWLNHSLGNLFSEFHPSPSFSMGFSASSQREQRNTLTLGSKQEISVTVSAKEQLGRI